MVNKCVSPTYHRGYELKNFGDFSLALCQDQTVKLRECVFSEQNLASIIEYTCLHVVNWTGHTLVLAGEALAD